MHGHEFCFDKRYTFQCTGADFTKGLKPGADFTNGLKPGFGLKFKTLVLNSVKNVLSQRA